MQLNTTKTKEIKEFYENNIQTAIAQAIKVNEEKIKVNWDFDEVKIRVEVVNNDNVVIYNFIFANNDLIFKTESYKVLFASNDNYKYINGIQSQENGISYNSLSSIKNLIEQELNKEFELNNDNEN